MRERLIPLCGTKNDKNQTSVCGQIVNLKFKIVHIFSVCFIGKILSKKDLSLTPLFKLKLYDITCCLLLKIGILF